MERGRQALIDGWMDSNSSFSRVDKAAKSIAFYRLNGGNDKGVYACFVDIIIIIIIIISVLLLSSCRENENQAGNFCMSSHGMELFSLSPPECVCLSLYE